MTRHLSRAGISNKCRDLENIGGFDTEELLTKEEEVAVREASFSIELEPGPVRGVEVSEIVIAVLAGIDLRVSAAHEAVFIEDDIAIFATKGSAGFGEAVDVLGNVSDPDLYEFEVAAERWGAHVSCAVDRTRFVRYDLFKAFEANEFAAGEEAVARAELNFASDANERAIEAVEVFDVELSAFDEQSAVPWGEESIGGEARIAGTSDDCFVVFEGDADAIRAVFVDGDQRDIERDGCKLDFRELFFGGIIAEVSGAEAAIFI